MGAITFQSFNEEPERASRPFDVRREGFVPAHGGGVLVLEELESALRRGARVYAELVGVDSNSDANHLPQPSEEGQVRLITKVLRQHGIAPEEIDYVNAHATSTPLGDLTEIRSLKKVFGQHAARLKVNATKSMLGHTCWAAPVVETIAAVLQMNAGRLHPSINVDELDPEVDLDVCAGTEDYDFVAASKAVMETLCRYLNYRLSDEDIRINVVRSRLVRTESLSATFGRDFVAFAEGFNMKRQFITCEEVANAILGLCSGLMDGVSGQVIMVDRGTSFADNLMRLYNEREALEIGMEALSHDPRTDPVHREDLPR